MANKSYRRRMGDRKEGRRIRSLAPFYTFTPFIMSTRNDACNYFQDSVEITEIDRFLRQKRTDGWKSMGMLHLLISAYIRTLASRPALNRFIAGQRIYSRNNIEVVLTVKRALSASATETTIKVEFEPTDTIYDVYRKMNEKIDDIKADNGANNTEQVAGALMKLPGLLLKFAIGIIRFLDYFGWLPRAIMDASPFHGSMIISDLGSLGIPPIYHHLYNFGTLPIFICFGSKRREVGLDENRVPVERKYIDYTVVTDERICDGQYYAASLKYIKHYLKNPHLLEQPPEEVLEDIF